MQYTNRISCIKSKLAHLEIEALLFFDMKNIRYLTGFSGSDGALLVGKNKFLLMVDGRYVTQAKGEVKKAEIVEYNDKIEGIVREVTESGLQKVSFESGATSFDSYLSLRDKLEKVELRPISKEISSIRAVKDQNEIESIQKAVEISSQALISTLDLVRPGIRERDIALELEYRMRGNGAESISFKTIVASGENTALPHATAGYRTCTFIIGSVTDRQKEIYGIVKDAHDKAVDSVRAGVSCSEVDRIARSHIVNAGLGKYFSHGTGHGVGLDVHEAPRLFTKAEGYLEKGMVVTIEPGVYIPDRWGVRIEDMVLVKEDGCEVLTKIPKDLRILG
jgi:Xaa-Pro aminopeptidase